MINLVQGWTERIRYGIVADGAALDLTGMSVALVAYSRTGAQLTLAGQAGIVNAATGEVHYDPNAADFLASDSPILVRWKITDGSGKVAFFPNGRKPEEWVVSRP